MTNVLNQLKREFMSSDVTKKIKEYLSEEIAEANEIIAEYTSEHRPKCDDGSDDFIEGNRNLAQRLLLKIEDWEKNLWQTHNLQKINSLNSKRNL